MTSVLLEKGRLDLNARQLVTWEGDIIRLTPKEASIAAHLARSPTTAISRAELYSDVLGYSPTSNSRTLDVSMVEIRRKLEKVPSHPRHFQSVPQIGYLFRPLEADPNVPNDTWLVGRTAEVQRVLAELQRERWVSLIGAGGIGKSAIARQITQMHPDTISIDCVAVDRLLDLRARLGELVQLDAAIAGFDTMFGERAGTRLVVLDNIDAGLEPIGGWIASQTNIQPRLRILSTSRRAAGRAEELRVEVGPLSADASVQLLKRIAARIRPGWGDEPKDRPALSQLSALLDGHPLAITLAASRASAFSPPELAVELRGSPELLMREPGESTGRIRSLAEVVAWSTKALNPAALQVLQVACHFENRFALSDLRQSRVVEAVGPAVADLVDHHLVLAAGEGQYRLLLPIRSILRDAAPPNAIDAYVRACVNALPQPLLWCALLDPTTRPEIVKWKQDWLRLPLESLPPSDQLRVLAAQLLITVASANSEETRRRTIAMFDLLKHCTEAAALDGLCILLATYTADRATIFAAGAKLLSPGGYDALQQMAERFLAWDEPVQTPPSTPVLTRVGEQLRLVNRMVRAPVDEPTFARVLQGAHDHGDDLAAEVLLGGAVENRCQWVDFEPQYRDAADSGYFQGMPVHAIWSLVLMQGPPSREEWVALDHPGRTQVAVASAAFGELDYLADLEPDRLGRRPLRRVVEWLRAARRDPTHPPAMADLLRNIHPDSSLPNVLALPALIVVLHRYGAPKQAEQLFGWYSEACRAAAPGSWLGRALHTVRRVIYS